MTKPIKIAITGAAGQIGYSLLFRLAAGNLLGPSQPISLSLLEVTPALKALQGVVMELEDCAFPQLQSVTISDDPFVAFAEADLAFLVGAMPRKAGMERGDLLNANGGIFKPQGFALSEAASRSVKVLVVGNPANTNALIAQKNAPNLAPSQFHAMMRLDHNRSVAQAAKKIGCSISQITNMTVWGNHSSTQFPDLYNATYQGKSVFDVIGDQEWYVNSFIPTVSKRGAAVIESRGLSSAASAANAAIDHMRDWVLGTTSGSVSMGIASDGSYNIPSDLIFGFPCLSTKGSVSIVQGYGINELAQEKISLTANELIEERDTVLSLGLIS